jgi:thioredoxin-related protein
MNSNKAIDAALAAAAAESQSILLIFSGTTCPWCERLKTALADEKLQAYCAEENIRLQWMTLGPKDEEADQAQAAGEKPARERFGIKSIPTAILFNENGVEVCSTEYLDGVEIHGGMAYVEWLKENSLI